MKRHHVIVDEDVQWQFIEETAELLEAPERDEVDFYEDSELTITVDWGDRNRGTLTAGMTVLDPIASTATVDLFVVGLESYVGTVSFALQSASGEELHAIEAEARRRKLATDDDLHEMKQHWSATHIPVNPGVARRVYDSASARVGETTPAQWAKMARDLFQPLVTATRSIKDRPKKEIRRESRVVPQRKIKKPDTSTVLSALRGRRHVETTTPQWGPDPGAEAMAARDARRVLQHIRRLREGFAEENEELDPRLRRTFNELSRHLQAIASKSTGSEKPTPRQSVLHDPRYRLLHRASLLSRRAVDPGEGDINAYQPPTPALYEEWCAWALVEELAPEERQPELRAELSAPYEDRHLVLRDDPSLELFLQYDMAIGEWRHRPDLVLRLEGPDRIAVLDVKYRGRGEGLTQVPGDAIAELHRYRDVYKLENPDVRHKQMWTAILHPAPGWQDGSWVRSGAFQSAVDEGNRVGAIPVSPSLRSPLQEYLRETSLGP